MYVFISIIQPLNVLKCFNVVKQKQILKTGTYRKLGGGSVWLSNGVVFSRSTYTNYNHGMYVYYMIVMTKAELNESDTVDRNSKENPTRRIQLKSVQKIFFT